MTCNGLSCCLSLILFMMTFIVFSATTTPTKLADGLGSILQPLTIVRFPVQKFVLMISLAFRFIPLLIDEVDSMLMSQKLRHSHFSDESFRMKIQFFLQLLVALFIAVLRRANQLALAMDARCYLPGNKIRFNRLSFRWRDWMVIISTLILILVQIMLKGAA